MVIYPNHPVLFGVFHDQPEVKDALPNFRKIIKGKKVLYLEIDAESLSVIPGYTPKVRLTDKFAHENAYQGMMGSYQILAREALRAGLKVIPLDTRKDYDAHFKMSQDQNVSRERVAYDNLEKREKKWVRTIGSQTSKALVVAAPEHILGMREKLGVPKENCVIFEYVSGKAWRASALVEKRRIEMERLERMRRKARQRRR